MGNRDMKKEDKELLMKDLCARLPYGLKCYIYRVDDFGVGWRDAILNGFVLDDHVYEFYFDDYVYVDSINKVKPYLFPLSSMTEEQRKEYDKIIYHSVELHYREYSDIVEIDLFDILQDFYCKNHLDYRGLIDKGLALDATNKNIY